jgi:rubrerythrin
MVTMAQSNNLGTLLDLVAQLEDAAYGFYAKLRERCPDNPEAAELLAAIMEDELLHARVIQDLTQALPSFHREASVPPDLIERLEQTLECLRARDEELFESTDATCSAIEKMESLEFDVVLSFVNVPEFEYDSAASYVRNQAVDHTNKVYRLLRSLG